MHRSHSYLRKFSSSAWPYAIHTSNLMINTKSSFLAHASTFTSSSNIAHLLDHICLENSHIKRATHCMYAWSTGGANPKSSDQNDGGERGAGSQLARILDLSGAENVVIVVWRWHGGVRLGSERWRVIKTVAVEALDNGGWIKKGR